VSQVYRRRITAFEARPDIACAFLFKNVGAAAGASIAHNHSQLLGLPAAPPRLQSELRACRRHGCIHCDEVRRAALEQRVIVQGTHHVLLSPSTPKLPYEVWLLPTAHASDFGRDDHDADLIDLLGQAYARLQTFDGGAFNSCLHRLDGEDFHWHFEFQPRLGQVAALELGGDMYINAVTAAESAARWRQGT
jgi:UDPglucose--hexose-1-phosphate uridylyltransferase